MTHRVTNPEPPIVDKIIADKAAAWTKDVLQAAPTDAQNMLEALLAEYGVEAAVHALDNQGFVGDAMRPLLKALYIEAVRRRKLAQPDWSAAASSETKYPVTDEEFEAVLAELDEVWDAMGGTQDGPVPELPITREEIYREYP